VNPRSRAAENATKTILVDRWRSRCRPPPSLEPDAVKNIEAAFTPTHSRPRFFAGTAASAVLDQLHKGLAHAQPFMLVLGTPGAGKTFDVLEACARWGTRAVTRWVDLRTTSADAVLDTLLRAFDVDTPTQTGRRPRIEALARDAQERSLHRHRGRRARRAHGRARRAHAHRQRGPRRAR
jgi:hypothetical protein